MIHLPTGKQQHLTKPTTVLLAVSDFFFLTNAHVAFKTCSRWYLVLTVVCSWLNTRHMTTTLVVTCSFIPCTMNLNSIHFFLKKNGVLTIFFLFFLLGVFLTVSSISCILSPSKKKLERKIYILFFWEKKNVIALHIFDKDVITVRTRQCVVIDIKRDAFRRKRDSYLALNVPKVSHCFGP